MDDSIDGAEDDDDDEDSDPEMGELSQDQDEDDGSDDENFWERIKSIWINSTILDFDSFYTRIRKKFMLFIFI